mmetsp:Transcript_119774/g.382305  ORF Transcript_119774/g.382305 Transcript_119774/m.382305 type:complete len:84 (-) Transcript_119774:3-254(-)
MRTSCADANPVQARTKDLHVHGRLDSTWCSDFAPRASSGYVVGTFADRSPACWAHPKEQSGFPGLLRVQRRRHSGCRIRSRPR